MSQIDPVKLADVLDGIYCTLQDIRTTILDKNDVYITWYLSDLEDLVEELRRND